MKISSLEELEEQVGFDLKDIRWLPFDGKSNRYSMEGDGVAVIRYPVEGRKGYGSVLQHLLGCLYRGSYNECK